MSKVEYDLDTTGGLMDVSRKYIVFVQKMRLEDGVKVDAWVTLKNHEIFLSTNETYHHAYFLRVFEIFRSFSIFIQKSKLFNNILFHFCLNL